MSAKKKKKKRVLSQQSMEGMHLCVRLPGSKGVQHLVICMPMGGRAGAPWERVCHSHLVGRWCMCFPKGTMCDGTHAMRGRPGAPRERVCHSHLVGRWCMCFPKGTMCDGTHAMRGRPGAPWERVGHPHLVVRLCMCLPKGTMCYGMLLSAGSGLLVARKPTERAAIMHGTRLRWPLMRTHGCCCCCVFADWVACFCLFLLLRVSFLSGPSAFWVKVDAVTQPSLKPLADLLRTVIWKDVASSTASAYQRALHRWEKWAVLCQVTSFPAAPTSVCLYIVKLL